MTHKQPKCYPIHCIDSMAYPQSSFIRSAAFSPIMKIPAIGYPDKGSGIIDASATRTPVTPRTLVGRKANIIQIQINMLNYIFNY